MIAFLQQEVETCKTEKEEEHELDFASATEVKLKEGNRGKRLEYTFGTIWF